MSQLVFDIDELIVDSFAGGGGASTGIEAALGRPVDIAVNHNAEALALHAVNHPHTVHIREDVWAVDPRAALGKRQIGLLWASPDCKHFSKAKGGKPVSKRIRGLAWVVCKWASATGEQRPRVIMLENVEEFQDWGPLKMIDGEWFPDPDRKGETFQRFVGRLRRLGYKVEWKQLRACDYGAPTIRKRLFLIARRDGVPIVWPKPTHGKGRTPYRTAAECIDWSIPCPSIFERKKPLAEATMRRIARGIQRYVVDAPTTFIVPIANYGSGLRVNATDEPLTTITANPKGGSHAVVVPMLQHATHGGREHEFAQPSPTVTGAHRGELQMVAATLVQTGYGERAGQAPRALDIEQPLGTVVGSGAKHAVVAAFLAQHYGGFYDGAGRSLEQPMPTAVAIPNQNQVVTSHLVKLRGTCKDGQPVTVPAPTTTASGTHVGEVRAFLIKYYGTDQDPRLEEPLHTVSTKDRFGLVTVRGELYQIVDIGMRMLTPRELARAQGFPDSYLLDRGTDLETGEPIKLTKTQQVRMIGNSVCPPVAEAIVRSNFAHERMMREAV